MVTIREFREDDYEEVVKMQHALLKEVYPNHLIKNQLYCYRAVLRWIDFKYDIMVTEKDGEITGFCLCYMDSMSGMVADYYQAEAVYIKPKYRKGRSAYLMYKSAMIYADKMGLIIGTNATHETESSGISSKLGKPSYTHYERIPNVKK